MLLSPMIRAQSGLNMPPASKKHKNFRETQIFRYHARNVDVCSDMEQNKGIGRVGISSMIFRAHLLFFAPPDNRGPIDH